MSFQEMLRYLPDKLTKHLLPCHVRLLDGTDLYCQLPVSRREVQALLTMVRRCDVDQADITKQ